MPRYEYRSFGYERPPELSGGKIPAYRIAIVGAGPVGLAMAIDLACRGVASVVLDDNDTVSAGSRAICWAKRTLEIFDRLGIGERMVEKGVTWKVGRVYRGDREIYSFDLLPEEGHKMPAFVNLQQYYVEEYLVDRARDFPDLIDLRFRNRVTGIEPAVDGATLSVETPEGSYSLRAGYVLACDGARSPLRSMLGLAFEGQLFEERFLIADVEMKADFPSERRFWFEPTFHKGKSALLHKQPDDIWRIDLQLGSDADPEVEKKPENVLPRIRAAIGDRPFELDWVSVYSFRCARLERFVHGRVIFVGDSAHVVSPFGARGGNGGIQDVDNLGWKLAAVLEGRAPEALLETYDARARPWRAGEHPQFGAHDELHDAEIGDGKDAARRGAGSRRGPAVCPQADQFRPALGSVFAGSLLPARGGGARAGAAGVRCARRAARRGRPPGVAPGEARRRFRPRRVRGRGPASRSRLPRIPRRQERRRPRRPGGSRAFALRRGSDLSLSPRPACLRGLCGSGSPCGDRGTRSRTVRKRGCTMIDLGTDRLGPAGDDFYEDLLAAHNGLTLEESAALNARLVLLLANQVGDLATLRAALEAARPKNAAGN